VLLVDVIQTTENKERFSVTIATKDDIFVLNTI